MKVKIIDYGYENLPLRAHYNDAGADVYACPRFKGEEHRIRLWAHSSAKIPLGFGLEIPDGYMGLVFPRSGLSSKGITCELPPIDSGYRGEIHAIMTNNTNTDYWIEKGDRIGQLVIIPVVVADFITDTGEERGTGAFGSTGL
ncbi:MAG: deoxyuridine 5'-triphosphate nucleotidohydrolase [Butyrivibrio sp.]|nr:deoxyuridine 5'-triphosphate nucleotidohydrolase [Butyrivibrio sp.]